MHYKEIISEGEWAFLFNLTIEFVIKDIGSRSYVPCIKYLSKYIMNLIFFSVSRWPYYPLIDKHLDGPTFEKKKLKWESCKLLWSYLLNFKNSTMWIYFKEGKLFPPKFSIFSSLSSTINYYKISIYDAIYIFIFYFNIFFKY